MCTKMTLRIVSLCMIVSVFVMSGMAEAEIIMPTILSEANTNPYSTATTDKLNDNSGMTPVVNTGDSLATALAAVHANTGVFDSWVTNDAPPDYFATSLAPVIVWDVTGGGDSPVGTAIFWQYQNDGGGDNKVGNHARTVELQFNTEAEGAVTFAGSVTTLMLEPTLTGDLNVAQAFALSGDSYRYVLMAVTDNHFGDPDGLGVHATIGGDRVGLGEVRFASEVIPEPATIALLGTGVLALIRRRRLS